MKINRENLRIFRKDFEEAMKALEEKHDIKVSVGKITFSSVGFTCKMTCDIPINLAQTISSQSAAPFSNLAMPGVESAEQKRFALDCALYGFQADDYMMPLRDNGKTYFFSGFKTNSPKNSCKIRNEGGGKEYVTSAAWVRAHKALFGAGIIPPMQLHTRKFANENDAEQAAEYAQE